MSPASGNRYVPIVLQEKTSRADSSRARYGPEFHGWRRSHPSRGEGAPSFGDPFLFSSGHLFRTVRSDYLRFQQSTDRVTDRRSSANDASCIVPCQLKGRKPVGGKPEGGFALPMPLCHIDHVHKPFDEYLVLPNAPLPSGVFRYHSPSPTSHHMRPVRPTRRICPNSHSKFVTDPSILEWVLPSNYS